MVRRVTNSGDARARLGIEHAIVQGPFGGGLSTVQLAATVSNLGGLGSFGAHILTPDQIARTTAEIREKTSKPFAMNLWVSNHDPGGSSVDAREFERLLGIFRPFYRELGVDEPSPPERFHFTFEEQVEALLEARPPVFSFVFGIPRPEILAECKRREIVTVGAATSIAEARALDEAGVDLIVATGFEAGGHRPSFLARAEDSLMGTFVLVQLVAPRVKAPVIAAGGIVDARGVRAAHALGASAAQIGTAFLACEESGATAGHRELLFSDRAEHTVLTRAFTGRLARGIENRFTREMSAVAPYPVQQWFASHMKRATSAPAATRAELVSAWASQASPNLVHRNAASLMSSLLSD